VLPYYGGLEDQKMTASAAYRNLYEKAKEHLGPVSYLQERMAWGSDLALGLADSHRTEGDKNTLDWTVARKPALRWYKNRRLVHFDMDGKALMTAGNRLKGENYKIDETHRQAILTVNYAISGRLLLTEDFGKFPPEVIYDLSRTIPYHTSSLTARPVDAFIHDQPFIYDMAISPGWHQLVLWNSCKDERKIEAVFAGDAVNGALGLDPGQDYYLYDFWNNRFLGTFSGADTFSVDIPSMNAKMISIHRVEDHPQWLSTDRHVMQGYVDLVEKPAWDADKATLTGTSVLIGGEAYRMTVALNGSNATKVKARGAAASIEAREDPELVDVVLTSRKNREVNWSIYFNLIQ
jgi:hypothetical protein